MTPEDYIRAEKKRIKKWFENLLNIDDLKFKINVTQDDCDGFMDTDLSRKVLYYDTVNHILSTHSPYGSHWEKARAVVKLKTTENFRWVIKGEEYLSICKPCVLTIENYDKGIIKTEVCNMNNLKELIENFS